MRSSSNSILTIFCNLTLELDLRAWSPGSNGLRAPGDELRTQVDLPTTPEEAAEEGATAAEAAGAEAAGAATAEEEEDESPRSRLRLSTGLRFPRRGGFLIVGRVPAAPLKGKRA